MVEQRSKRGAERERGQSTRKKIVFGGDAASSRKRGRQDCYDDSAGTASSIRDISRNICKRDSRGKKDLNNQVV